MARYFTTQIINKKLMYHTVIKKYSTYKDGIDTELTKRGYFINSQGLCCKL